MMVGLLIFVLLVVGLLGYVIVVGVIVLFFSCRMLFMDGL